MSDDVDVGRVAWMDQVQAEFRDMAQMAALYFSYLMVYGLPRDLCRELVKDWHSIVWESNGTGIDTEVEDDDGAAPS